MLIRTDIDVLGADHYSRSFKIMADDAEDLSEPLRRIGEHIRLSVGEQFGSEGTAKGAPWAPLSADYAEWKDIHYPGMPILVATGNMRRLLLSPSAITVTPHKMVYDPRSDIWHFHQLGTRFMPARKMVVVRPDDMRQWDRYFHEWINYLRHRPMGLR